MNDRNISIDKMNNFIKKLIGFSIGPVIGAMITFITIPLTTHFINPSEYGKASIFLLLQTIVATFLYLGVDQAYTREYHSIQNKKLLFQNAILIPLILAILIFIVILLFLSDISLLLFGDEKFKIATILFGIMIIAMVVERFILLSLRMQEKALEYSLLTILTKLSILIFTLIFIFFLRRDFLAVVYSAIIGQLLADLYLIIRYRKLFKYKGFSINKKLLKRMILFGLPILIATSISSLLNSLDRLALRAWSDFYEVGIFTATLKIAGVLSIIQLSFTSFWTPTAYRWYDQKKDIKYFKLVSDGILLCMSVIFMFIVGFKDLIVYILSPEYSDSRYIVAFLCLQPIIYTVSETTSLGIVFSRKTYLSIWVGVVAVIPNFVINLLLVPKLGALGAAIATAVSYICFFAARTYFSSKNGMAFSVVNHYIVLTILFFTAVVNAYLQSYLILINSIVFVILIISQASTIKKIFRFYQSEKFKVKDKEKISV
ncbi:lipopolysaccharide biosynthesis protein [Priestia flexa]|uniref:lipopolysaccharide biosynthesis protein n=1 Tax=Priestia flexa TaxID=86664 RepID=UPI000A77C709|nr:oligosaccharide flippase family protein [Priestia flexa]MED4588169.1 oligosaccharide flippase family protein [Priestia flexa]